MASASWNGVVIAESDDIVMVEGNLYFPQASITGDYLRPSETTTECNWKGTANYYDVVVDGMTNPDAAWTYREPKPKAEKIRNRIAFWHGIDVQL
ncbi:MAG: DUF427 domain-containing protein [Gammaproteobacteria bacterium]|nr:DUF427 domain-containing protein [Gammaproteobacteria bacterium]MCW8959121.1 DUF427 domain-containing protein [Gammaproteobacteria bacterium]MCW8972175.1 DUF427 domain-containing protein [Gammaproteobacteria bacterium]MCW8991825.1 DUF427 domain-containing protein [Gammaproteobacteria bacterium]